MQTMMALSNLLLPTGYWPDAHTGSSDPCTWRGVGCNATSHSSSQVEITALSLAGSGLHANITDTFFDLLCQLNSLQSLDLSYNYFTYIPTSFLSNCSGLPRLRSLNLSSNILAGTLGTLKLKNLKLLDLSFNNLSGSIPDGIFRELSKLQHLQLSHNRLTGEIPAGITKYINTLNLSYNMLTGISSDLLSPPPLSYVDLSYNLLQGPIPANISSGLNYLRLSGNSLVGTIPVTICSLNTTSLELDNNKLDGQIPPQLGNCQNLALFNLSANRLQGEIPKELGNLTCPGLSIYLQDNNLSGEIPKELLTLEKLLILDISHNSLTGAIPSEFSSLHSLERLNLEGNKLNGSIPHTISTLNNLRELHLGNNKLNGKVPVMPRNLILSLNLSGNLLTGPIPSYLGDLQQLQILDLSNNEFTSEVPSSLTLMQSLTLLDLSNNLLSGIPPHFLPWIHVYLTGNKDIGIDENKDTVNQDTVARPLDRFAISVMVASFVGGFFVSIVLARIFQCFYNGKYETSTASRRDLHEPEPQLVELQNLRRIRRQLDAAAAKYR